MHHRVPCLIIKDLHILEKFKEYIPQIHVCNHAYLEFDSQPSVTVYIMYTYASIHNCEVNKY